MNLQSCGFQYLTRLKPTLEFSLVLVFFISSRPKDETFLQLIDPFSHPSLPAFPHAPTWA